MAGSRTLTRLEKKFLVLRQRQEAMQARYKAQLKETQRAIVDKRNELIVQTIRRMDFPTDKPVILIGVLLFVGVIAFTYRRTRAAADATP